MVIACHKALELDSKVTLGILREAINVASLSVKYSETKDEYVWIGKPATQRNSLSLLFAIKPNPAIHFLLATTSKLILVNPCLGRVQKS